jgi:hypothetical protein
MKNDFLKLGCRRDAIACEKPSLSAFINGKEAALPKFERRGRLEQINSPWAITTTYFDLSTDVRQGKNIHQSVFGKAAAQFRRDAFRSRGFSGGRQSHGRQDLHISPG